METRITIEGAKTSGRKYCFTTRISQISHSFQEFPRPLRADDERVVRKLIEVGEPATSLVPKLLAIPGVRNVAVWSHSLRVSKGKAFRWIEIEGPLFEVLRKFFLISEEVFRLGSFPKDLPLVHSYGSSWEEEFTFGHTTGQGQILEPRRIVVEVVVPRRAQVYHTTCEISNYPGRWTEGYPLEEVGKVGTSLLMRLGIIPGIEKVGLEPYQLLVIKKDTFNWYEEVEPPLLEALQRCFGSGEEPVKVFR